MYNLNGNDDKTAKKSRIGVLKFRHDWENTEHIQHHWIWLGQITANKP